MVQNFDALLLQNQLCFPLYACSREIIKRYRPHLDALGLTYTQYIVMIVVWAEGTVSVRDLGKQLFLDSGTLTPVLKTLEKTGLITRNRSKEDERVLLISTTAQGIALREKALSIPQNMACCLKLSQEDRATLHRLLYQVLADCREE